MEIENSAQNKTVLVQFKSENGEILGDHLDLPRAVTNYQLQLICNALLKKVIFFIFNNQW